MDTMNISLPPALKEYVDAQVNTGNFSTVSEYIRQLICEDQKRKEREDIDRKLMEAVDGGTTPLTAKDWQYLREEIRRRASHRAKK
jgi:antitoxin ParD1/3/4